MKYVCFLLHRCCFLLGFCWLVALLFPLAVAASQTSSIPARLAEESLSAQPYLDWMLDPTGTLTIEEVSAPAQQEHFRPLLQNPFPFQAGTLWLRFTLDAASDSERPLSVMLDMGSHFPKGSNRADIPMLYEPQNNPLNNAALWKGQRLTQNSFFLLPEPRKQPFVSYIRLGGLPAPWFAPIFRTPHNAATSTDRLAFPMLAAMLGMLTLFCFLRILSCPQESWRLWTGLFALLAFIQAFQSIPVSTTGAIALKNALPLCVTALTLAVLPHIARSLMQTPGQAPRLDRQYRQLSLILFALPLMPLLPPLAWMSRFLAFWPLLMLLLLPTTLIAYRAALPAARRFLIALLLPPCFCLLLFLFTFTSIPTGLLMTLPLWGVACSIFYIAGTRLAAPSASSSVPSKKSASTHNLRASLIYQKCLAIPFASFCKIFSRKTDPQKSPQEIKTTPLLRLLEEGLAKLTSFSMRIQPEETLIAFNVQQLLRDAHDAAAQEADSKHIALSWYMPPHLAHHYIGNKAMLQHLLQLFLRSALRTTQNGSVQLAVRRDPESTDPNRLLFTVTDTSQETSRERPDPALLRAWELCDDHSGSLALKSEPKGNTIAFSLQLSPMPAMSKKQIHQIPRILLLDSNTASRSLLRFFFEGLPYEIIEARTPTEALTLHQSNPVHLLIFSGELREREFISVMPSLRAKLPNGHKLRLLALPEDEIQWQALQELGFSLALESPVPRSRLRAIAQNLLPLPSDSSSSAASCAPSRMTGNAMNTSDSSHHPDKEQKDDVAPQPQNQNTLSQKPAPSLQPSLQKAPSAHPLKLSFATPSVEKLKEMFAPEQIAAKAEAISQKACQGFRTMQSSLKDFLAARQKSATVSKQEPMQHVAPPQPEFRLPPPTPLDPATRLAKQHSAMSDITSTPPEDTDRDVTISPPHNTAPSAPTAQPSAVPTPSMQQKAPRGTSEWVGEPIPVVRQAPAQSPNAPQEGKVQAKYAKQAQVSDSQTTPPSAPTAIPPSAVPTPSMQQKAPRGTSEWVGEPTPVVRSTPQEHISAPVTVSPESATPAHTILAPTHIPHDTLDIPMGENPLDAEQRTTATSSPLPNRMAGDEHNFPHTLQTAAAARRAMRSFSRGTLVPDITPTTQQTQALAQEDFSSLVGGDTPPPLNSVPKAPAFRNLASLSGTQKTMPPLPEEKPKESSAQAHLLRVTSPAPTPPAPDTLAFSAQPLLSREEAGTMPLNMDSSPSLQTPDSKQPSPEIPSSFHNPEQEAGSKPLSSFAGTMPIIPLSGKSTSEQASKRKHDTALPLYTPPSQAFGNLGTSVLPALERLPETSEAALPTPQKTSAPEAETPVAPSHTTNDDTFAPAPPAPNKSRKKRRADTMPPPALPSLQKPAPQMDIQPGALEPALQYNGQTPPLSRHEHSPRKISSLAAEQLSLVPLPDKAAQQDHSHMLSLRNTLEKQVQNVTLAFQAHNQTALQLESHTLAAVAESHGLRDLSRMARCVHSASQAEDIQALNELMPQLENAFAMYISHKH